MGDKMLKVVIALSLAGFGLYLIASHLHDILAWLAQVPFLVWFALFLTVGAALALPVYHKVVEIRARHTETRAIRLKAEADYKRAEAEEKKALALQTQADVQYRALDVREKEIQQRELSESRDYHLKLMQLKIDASRVDFGTQVLLRENGDIITMPAVELKMQEAIVGPRGAGQGQIAAPAHSLEHHVPTFRESLEKGLIGPGQKKMLLCHELLTDDRGMYIGYEPYQDELENNSTVFLGGASKSGKSTYMAHIGAQGALMNALYYCIDPHLMHPEKSVAKKLEALAHAFILPPARTEPEIWKVLNHAKGVAEARKDGRETPYGDRMIIFIVDEALAVLSMAHHTQNKEIILMYRDLALFLRDLGTQYAKFGVSGIIASQYVTKDAFKLPAPAGNIDFRDGCQNQILMRLPPNQAQAMRLIEAKDLRGVRTLPQGHGYMGTYEGTVLRMASGNVTRQDIEYVASLVEAVPSQRKQYAVPDQYPISTQGEQSSPPVLEREIIDGVPPDVRSVPLRSVPVTVSTGPLTTAVKPLTEGSEQGSTSGTQGTGKPFKKRFTPEQEVQFLNLYKQHKSIKTAITKMHVSYGDYQPYASWLAQQNGGM